MSKLQVTTPTSRPQTTRAQASVVTSVVLPTYNEVENLGPLVEELFETFERVEMAAYRPFEVWVVDGGSDDGTRELIQQLQATNEEVKGLFLRRKFGQSPALAAGFDQAEGRFIVPMDADLQNDPADIPALLQKLERDNLDCVSGWRRDRNDPWHKTIPSRLQTHLAKLTGPDINDFGCTLKAYRREAINDVQVYGEGHRYIPAKLHKLGYSIGELEVNHRARKHGESRYGAGRLVRGFVDLLFHAFWVRYSSRPLHIFGAVGFLCMVLGGSIGAVSVVQRYLFGVALGPRTPRLILVVLLVTFGLQVLVFGVLAEILVKLYYSDKREYRLEREVE